ncbi:tRNA pseudouridine(38-40) synthase TruA [Winogradskyella maritima]|uniref:tRNA pseudouridine synthase A n=1 Tax=Winogradskyella maritima TaxID=1517766 RepID=A0ABV8AK15_9FLAO|nr:tRNA pseudouridine(38-40) synthase TruA [Winogradskyella maritima]
MRYFIELAYNGKQYHGWQVQPNAVTVQEVLDKALSLLLGEPISILGAGRTDAGVHASQMFAHFDISNSIEDDNIVYRLNSYLPPDIAIKDIFRVKDDTHARFDATSRTYFYKVSTSKDVFQDDQSYTVLQPLDVEAMNKAATYLLDYKDFKCFSKAHTDVKTYNCDIRFAQWKTEGEQLIFTITADRFLRNMVRAIVGTLINIGLGKLDVLVMHSIIESKDRSEAGFSVPAKGLFLSEITYPETIKLE